MPKRLDFKLKKIFTSERDLDVFIESLPKTTVDHNNKVNCKNCNGKEKNVKYLNCSSNKCNDTSDRPCDVRYKIEFCKCSNFIEFYQLNEHDGKIVNTDRKTLRKKKNRDTLQKIMEQVMINSSGKDTEYEWMALVTSQHQQQLQQKEVSTNKIKKRRTTNASFSKKTQFNQVSNALKLKRCKSTGSVILNKSSETKHISGIPWRTAARANRYKTRLTHHHEDDDDDFNNDGSHNMNEYDIDEEEEDDEKNSDYVTFTSSSNNNVPINYASSNSNSNKNNNNNNNNKNNDLHKTNLHFQVDNKSELDTNVDASSRRTINDLLNCLQREQLTKTSLERRNAELERENAKLMNQINLLQSNGASSKSNLNKSVLDDDALEIIEFTLHKYQKFLDFLKNAGLGKLITMAEYDGGETFNQQPDESTLSLYQDINQTTNSFDMTNQLINQQNTSGISHFLKRFNSNSNNNKEKQLHDTSNIDTLVTKSLEISRNYRRLNSSINNNNSVLPVNAHSGSNVKNSNSASSTSRTISNNELKQDKKRSHTKTNGQLQQNELTNSKKTTESLIREYNDMKNAFENIDSKDILNLKKANKFMQDSHITSSSSSSLSSVNSNKVLYNQNKDILIQRSNAEKLSTHHKNKSLPKTTKNVMDELSEIMSESIDNDVDVDETNRNHLDSDDHIEEDADEEEEEDDEDYEDFDESDDSSDENDDMDAVNGLNEENIKKMKNFAIENFTFNNVKLSKLDYKHESTKAYEDDDDVHDVINLQV